MNNEFILGLFQPFLLSQVFNHPSRDGAPDLGFCEIISLKSFPGSQSCTVEDAKSAATGAICFLAGVNAK